MTPQQKYEAEIKLIQDNITLNHHNIWLPPNNIIFDGDIKVPDGSIGTESKKISWSSVNYYKDEKATPVIMKDLIFKEHWKNIPYKAFQVKLHLTDEQKEIITDWFYGFTHMHNYTLLFIKKYKLNMI